LRANRRLSFRERNSNELYRKLVGFRRSTKKNVYVLASHSHFVINNVYATACRDKDDVLPGGIIGSAGAVRYRLPQDLGGSTVHQSDVYGYLLGTVAADGSISFEFKDVKNADVPVSVVKEFSQPQVDWCFEQNKAAYVPAGPVCGTAAPSASQ
jgi:hypothetical protein